MSLHYALVILLLILARVCCLTLSTLSCNVILSLFYIRNFFMKPSVDLGRSSQHLSFWITTQWIWYIYFWKSLLYQQYRPPCMNSYWVWWLLAFLSMEITKMQFNKLYHLYSIFIFLLMTQIKPYHHLMLVVAVCNCETKEHCSPSVDSFCTSGTSFMCSSSSFRASLYFYHSCSIAVY